MSSVLNDETREMLRNEVKDISSKSYSKGFIDGINNVSEIFGKLKEKQGDSRFTISEIIILIKSISGENAKLILESSNED